MGEGTFETSGVRAMLRIVAARDREMRWRAWWKDIPFDYEESGSMLGAVAKVLVSRGRGVSLSDLVTDQSVCRPWYVEMIVQKQDGNPD